MKSNARHIVVFRLSAMGDVAMSVPVLRALIEQNQNLKITVVSRPFFAPFFQDIPGVDFFPIDLNNRHKGFLGLLKLYSDLKDLGVDAFADLHNVLRSKIVRTLFNISGKKVAHLDKGRAEKKALTRPENKDFRPLKLMVERYTEVFRSMGFVCNLPKSISPIRKELSDKVIEISGFKDSKWLGIAPFAQYQSKVYPLDLMQELIDKLSKLEYKVFLFGGGKKEIELLQQLAKDYKNIIVVAGVLKFTQELELLSNLDVMLSMDSGNAHIASMYGIPTITLWGATHPYAGFIPFGQSLDNCITSDREKYPKLPTSVYGNKEVEGYQDAMRTIKTDAILQRIDHLMK